MHCKRLGVICLIFKNTIVSIVEFLVQPQKSHNKNHAEGEAQREAFYFSLDLQACFVTYFSKLFCCGVMKTRCNVVVKE